MTTRERLERRAERRREWADSRERKSAQAYQDSHAATNGIPFGQPILVGHHSERKHRNAIKRAQNAATRSYEHANMAKHHANKAAGIENQLARSVYSDDDNAIEALQARIDKREGERAQNNAINKIIRRKPKNESTPEKVAMLETMGLHSLTIAKLFEPDMCGQIGIPSYVNQNLSGNISRDRKRIEQIKARTARQKEAEASEAGIMIEGGTEWVSITFAEKPERETLNALKAAGFRWGDGKWSGQRASIPETLRAICQHEQN